MNPFRVGDVIRYKSGTLFAGKTRTVTALGWNGSRVDSVITFWSFEYERHMSGSVVRFELVSRPSLLTLIERPKRRLRV